MRQVADRLSARAESDGFGSALGIVLAGSYYWGEGKFERFLRGPLLRVAQRPIIRYPLHWLQASGICQVAICTNNDTEAIRRYLGDGARLGMTLHYVEDPLPRGAAGCVRDAALRLAADTVVVAEGALIPSLDLDALLTAHRDSGAVATAVVEVDRRRSATGGERSRLPGGIYVFERRVLERVPATGYYDIKQGLLERLYDEGERVLMHEVQGLSPRIMDYASYTAASAWLIASAHTRPGFYSGYVKAGDGMRHPSARIHPSARLIGPVLVGPGARIDAGAVVVGPTAIGAGSVVESEAVVVRSVLWERCVVGRGASLDGSLLSDDAVAEAGAVLLGEVHTNGAEPLSSEPADPVIFRVPAPLPERPHFEPRLSDPRYSSSRGPVARP